MRAQSDAPQGTQPPQGKIQVRLAINGGKELWFAVKLSGKPGAQATGQNDYISFFETGLRHGSVYTFHKHCCRSYSL